MPTDWGGRAVTEPPSGALARLALPRALLSLANGVAVLSALLMLIALAVGLLPLAGLLAALMVLGTVGSLAGLRHTERSAS